MNRSSSALLLAGLSGTASAHSSAEHGAGFVHWISHLLLGSDHHLLALLAIPAGVVAVAFHAARLLRGRRLRQATNGEPQ